MSDIRKAIAAGLTRTRDLLLTDVSDLVRSGRGLTPESLDDLEDILLAADLGVETSAAIRNRLEEETRQQKIEGPDRVLAMVAEVVEEMLQGVAGYRSFDTVPAQRPYVILMVGVNGSGKTTAIGKIAHRYSRAGRKVVIAAADTYRAAAVEQLQIWSDRAGAYCVRSHEGADPASVAYDALEAAIARDSDLLLVDTAGRLHNREGLMEELAKIRRVVDDPDQTGWHRTRWHSGHHCKRTGHSGGNDRIRRGDRRPAALRCARIRNCTGRIYMNRTRRLITVIWIAFFVSGTAGLVYEVVWARYLDLILGGTTYAHIMVLAAYMGGLASGAWFFGRLSDRLSEPLAIYSYLEMAIGVYGLAFPIFVQSLNLPGSGTRVIPTVIKLDDFVKIPSAALCFICP